MTRLIDPTATETAVLALMPAVEQTVGVHRRRLDPTSIAGVPAHVTVLYPFVEPAEVTAATVAELRAAVAPVASFTCRFSDTGWFGHDYLWLDPVPAGPFEELTRRVCRSFPDHPPYGGEHEPRPHLTVGYRRHASLEALRVAEAHLRASLPAEAAVDRVHLLAGARATDSWVVVAELPLCGVAPPAR